MQTQDDQDLPEPGRGALLISLLAKRKEAQTGRAGSGIEQEWIEDGEYYQGIDDANRAYAAQAVVICVSGRTMTSRGRKNRAVRSYS